MTSFDVRKVAKSGRIAFGIKSRASDDRIVSEKLIPTPSELFLKLIDLDLILSLYIVRYAIFHLK